MAADNGQVAAARHAQDAVTAPATQATFTGEAADSDEAAGAGDAEDAGLAMDAEPDMDDPVSDEAHPAAGTGAWEPASELAAGPRDDRDHPGADSDRPLLVPQQPLPAPVPAPSPHFDRMRSAPTPPEEEPEDEV